MYQKGFTAILDIKGSLGVSPELTPWNSLHAGDESYNRGIHPGVEIQSKNHQRSKIEVLIAPLKDRCPLKIKKWSVYMNLNLYHRMCKYIHVQKMLGCRTNYQKVNLWISLHTRDEGHKRGIHPGFDRQNIHH